MIPNVMVSGFLGSVRGLWDDYPECGVVFLQSF